MNTLKQIFLTFFILLGFNSISFSETIPKGIETLKNYILNHEKLTVSNPSYPGGREYAIELSGTNDDLKECSAKIAFYKSDDAPEAISFNILEPTGEREYDGTTIMNISRFFEFIPDLKKYQKTTSSLSADSRTNNPPESYASKTKYHFDIKLDYSNDGEILGIEKLRVAYQVKGLVLWKNHTDLSCDFN